ncbi:type IV secretory system conjugative DNA transfer family protein [Aurantimonas sp. VKM B-3413]|uniref:type IV secretory system conjugative DNA transfer family protein n=1 Tax=Aurantimonas sp. VKM B-3413 TaxID=2779401 RepID=UPI001E62C93C|nr:type IV secretory system conjugative DNA transfer family protein [Aurantimonas sp. VKM B-3413]MCB8839364.1 type IV secretory system conjugative DNA transfer family protein [Aurantimonas sp. VKM B-3413]
MSFSEKVRSALLVVIIIGIPYGGYLLAEAMTHGLNPDFWPESAEKPSQWWGYLMTLDRRSIIGPFYLMAIGRHPAFAGGGQLQFFGILAMTALAVIGTISGLPPSRPDRSDPAAQFGAARWASDKERRQLARGLELGLDPKTNRSVRVQVESNLLTIAPPRSGKTSAFVINNLLSPDATAWAGPAMVIDPKGEAYKAAGRRRAELGRPVHCLDFRRTAVGIDRWNPLERIDIGDVLLLQRTAYALLPSMKGENPYFRERGSMFLAGVIAAAVLEAQDEGRVPVPSDVERLLNDREELTELADAHRGHAILRSLGNDLRLDDRSLSPLISTAQQAVKWLLDPRAAALVTSSTFDLTEVARGRADLFVTIPTEDIETLSPFVRWLIADLFEAMRNRRQPDDERLMLFIDEAYTLGEFRQLLVALGEMPGRGLSIWSFWQSRGQIEETYGPGGARTIFGTAAVSTFSDVGGLGGGEDAEWFSKTLGQRTEFVETSGQQRRQQDQSSSTGRTPQAVPLMPAANIQSMSNRELIAIAEIASAKARLPMRLGKVRYFEDRRYAGLYEAAPPARSTQ